ncbi:STAS domain-containing protein [Streptomyces fungicidicus]
MTEDAGLGVEVFLIGPDTAILAVRGELDISTAPVLHHRLAEQVAHGRRHLLLDVTEMPFMDSSGLSVIVRTVNEVRDVGGTVSLSGARPVVRRLFDLTGVGLTCPLYDSVDDARRALAGEPGDTAADVRQDAVTR